MARLDRRTLEKLEDKYPKVSLKDSASEELEAYFQLVENYKAELEGRPPHPDLPEEDFSDLDWYWEELAEQEAARTAALRRREQI